MLCAALVAVAACRSSTLAPALSDAEFWSVSEALSEPAGAFTISDNLVSNEPRFAENARFVQARGGVYVGVGPEQNFSYIAKVRPATAFIVDIRRENRNLHLLYKALFEISSDRADFVSRLFSRPVRRSPRVFERGRSSTATRRRRVAAGGTPRPRSFASACGRRTAGR